MIRHENIPDNKQFAVLSRYLLVIGMMVAAGLVPAEASPLEDAWQSLEQWDREKSPDAVVKSASSPAAGLLPSLDKSPAASVAAPTAVAVEHKVEFAGLPPLFERAAATSPSASKAAKDKTAAVKSQTILPDPIAEVGRSNERRGLALTLPGAETSTVKKAATAVCAKSPVPVIDPRLASDRATLAALQNAVKSVGAEQAFDFMLPADPRKSLPSESASAMPDLMPLTLPPLP